MNTFEVHIDNGLPITLVVSGTTIYLDNFRAEVRKKGIRDLCLCATWISYLRAGGKNKLDGHLAKEVNIARHSLHEALRKKSGWIQEIFDTSALSYLEPLRGKISFKSSVKLAIYPSTSSKPLTDATDLYKTMGRLVSAIDNVDESRRQIETVIIVRNQMGHKRTISRTDEDGCIRHEESVCIITENNFSEDIILFWIRAENSVHPLFPENEFKKVKSGSVLESTKGHILKFPGTEVWPMMRSKYGTETCLILFGFGRFPENEKASLKNAVEKSVAKNRPIYYLSDKVTFSTLSDNNCKESIITAGHSLHLTDPADRPVWEKKVAENLFADLPTPKTSSYIQFINVPVRLS